MIERMAGQIVRGGTLAMLVWLASTVAAQTALHYPSIPPGLPTGGFTLSGGYLYGTAGPDMLFLIDTAQPCCPQFPYPVTGTWEASFGGVVEYGGYLYGTTRDGGNWGRGHIYRYSQATGIDDLAYFTTGGRNPEAGLIVVGSYLYGTTRFGGSSGAGTVFRYDPALDQITTLASFIGTNGAEPAANLVAVGSTLYGTTTAGGSTNSGTVFKMDLSVDPPTLTTVVDFNDLVAPLGREPLSELTVSGSFLFGTTYQGGTSGAGTIFKINTATDAMTTVHSFDGFDGRWPKGGLLLHGGMLYGTTEQGGDNFAGTLFELNPSTSTFSRVVSFEDFGFDALGFPDSRLTASGGYLYGMASIGTTGAGQIYRFELAGGTLEEVWAFYPPEGIEPTGAVAVSGNFIYGTARYGGGSGLGSVFRVDTTEAGPYDGFDATYESLDYFDGAFPEGGLILDGGTLYGTAAEGGDVGCGTIFEVDAATLAITRLASFDGSNGCNPRGPLLLNGTFLYGTTEYGGANNLGTVFKIDPAVGTLVTVASFDGVNGSRPKSGLIASGGSLYGVAAGNDFSADGTLYRLDSSDNFSVLATFDCVTSDNSRVPQGQLAAAGGYLWGVSSRDCFAGDGGTIFKVHPTTGAVTSVFTFDPPSASGTTAIGSVPLGGLTLSGSLLHGTASDGGQWGRGVYFTLDPVTETYSKRWSFDDYPAEVGRSPKSPLTASGGYLFGTAPEGGWGDAGVVFNSNTPPVLTNATGIQRTAGSPATVATVATVTDVEDSAGSLVVTRGYAVSGLNVGTATNSNGTVTVSIGAACTATVGTGNYFYLSARDGGFGMDDGPTYVEVLANPVPSLGTYSNVSANAGVTVTRTPSTPPSDNGSYTLTVPVPAGFTGTVTINQSTGVVTISNSNAGVHTFNVTSTDNCSATRVRSFTLTATEPFGAPVGLVATAVTTNQVALSWSPVESTTLYRVYRNNVEIGTSTVPSYTDNGVSPNTSYVYRVRAVAGSVNSGLSAPDAATTVIFANDPLAAGMPMLLAHLTQLRTAVNALHVVAGLGTVTFSDHPPSATTPVRAQHVTEMRAALAGARNQIGLSALSFIDPAITAGTTPIKAIHFQQIRNGVK